MSDAQRIILQLLYRSNHKLLKFSFILFPIALYISVSAYLFIDTLLRSYENHLSQSYLGYQGRLSIESDAKTIKAIADYANQKNYLFSPRMDMKHNIVIKNGQDIVKYAKIILLKQHYLKQKFGSLYKGQEHLLLNSVMAHNLGMENVSKIHGLFFEDRNQTLSVASTSVIDTGFLSSEPILFMSFERMREIFPELQESSIKSLEFFEKQNSVVTRIKKEIAQIAKEHQSMQVVLKDLLLDTKEHREFFEKLDGIKNIILMAILLFVVAIILASIALLIRFKYLSLKVLHFLGMSHLDLTRTITVMVAFVVIAMTLLGFISLGVWEMIFVSMSSFTYDFFIGVNGLTVILIVVSALLIIASTYFFTRMMFKGSKQ